jgi:zinc/manganese transport system permease protein
MALGGLAAGLLVAVLAGLVTRVTPVREDASFAGFYLISLAFGVVVVSMKGSNIDLLHVLFGTILAVDDASLVQVATIATVTLLALALLWRPLVADAFDPLFLNAQGERASLYHTAFLVLVVLNLVAAFQALGTLMAVGLMMLPAVGARFWAASVAGQMAAAALTAALAGVVGLLVSFHAGLPSGPAIVLAAGALWLLSLLLGARGGLLIRALPLRHLEA